MNRSHITRRRRTALVALALVAAVVSADTIAFAEGSGGSVDGSVTVAALVITEVVAPPTPPRAGSLTTITVRVRNDLPRPVTSVNVDTVGVISAGSVTATIAPGQTRDVLVPAWFCTGGPTPFTVSATALDGATSLAAAPASGQVDVAAGPGCRRDPEIDDLPIRVSTSPDRSAPGPLDGRIVSGVVHVIVDPTSPAVSGRRGIRRVEFRLDGQVLRTDGAAPFDLAGNRGANARGFDTTLLVDGTHRVRAIVTFRDGSTRSFLARFVVSNGTAAKTIQFSTLPDRSGAQPLAGATLTGRQVYIFVGPTTPIADASVYFRRDGRLIKVENVVPYDLGGTARNGTARPFPLTGLRRGGNTISVEFRLPGGVSITQTARFTRP